MADAGASALEERTRGNALGEASLVRRLSAEFLGTLILVAVGTGAATVLALGPATRLDELARGDALQVPTQGPSAQEVTFNQIFANTLGDILPVAFAFAIALAVLVYALGGVSGGHFNPAVTFALASVRRFRWVEVPLYWISQIAGGVAGAFVVAGIYGERGAKLVSSVPLIDPNTGQPAAGTGDITTNILFGATRIAENVDIWQAVLAEALITFILVTAIMAIAVDPRAPKGWSGLIIGLALAAGILVTAQATGGSANFARSLGPFVASLVYDVGNIPWDDLIVYAAGPIIGAVAAAFVYEGVTGLERVSPSPSPGAATPEPEALLDEVDEPGGGVSESAATTKTPPPTSTT
ncbi:MAG: aquaporin [Actinomycetota bacterium]|nr:aquaporin [Actinomycetota bacterium]